MVGRGELPVEYRFTGRSESVYTNSSRIKRMKLVARFALVLGVGCSLAVALLASCAYQQTPPGVTVKDVGTCREWDEEGNQPVDITQSFSAATLRVCMFAEVEANQDLWFGTGWYKDGRVVDQGKVRHQQGYLHSCLEPKNDHGLESGTYEVVLWLGRARLASVEFVISR